MSSPYICGHYLIVIVIVGTTATQSSFKPAEKAGGSVSLFVHLTNGRESDANAKRQVCLRRPFQVTLRQRLEAEASPESHLSKSSQHGSRFRQMSELQKWPKYEAGEKPVQLLTHYVPTDGSRQSRPSMLTSFLRTEAVGRGNPCNPVETGKPLFCRNLPGLQPGRERLQQRFNIFYSRIKVNQHSSSSLGQKLNQMRPREKIFTRF